MKQPPHEITFITGSTGKFREANAIIPSLKQLDLDLPEVQELNAEVVIGEKLKVAASLGYKNILVEDTSLSFNSLNGLPGPLIKWFLSALGNDGLWDLVKDRNDHSAVATTCLGFLGESGTPLFATSSVPGKIVSPRGTGFGWDPLFQPEGSHHTFGEMDSNEKESFSMRTHALRALCEKLAQKA